MNDTASRAVEALDDLVAELRHADALIDAQRTRIDELEGEVAGLQAALEARRVAA